VSEPRTAHSLEFDALRNALYHTARRQVLEGLSRWMNFLVILGGAGTVTQIAGQNTTASVGLGIAITAIGALQLVFDFAGRARTHELLQRRYYDLLSEIQGGGEPTIEQRFHFTREMTKIAGEEPPTYRALDAIAYNEALDAMLGPDEAHQKCKLNWWQNATRHFFHHNGASFA